VFLTPGAGNITVNKRDPESILPQRNASATLIRYPLTLTDNVGKFDIASRWTGGGIVGQGPGANRLGITKALIEFNAELRARLKRAGPAHEGLQDKREEKYGQKGARKRFQFSKRDNPGGSVWFPLR